MNDRYYIKLCFKLAKLGRGFVSPNPLVGSVIVKKNRIIGIGYFRRYGDKHAEIRAIEDAGSDVKDSTIYINLEPHSYYSINPPCTDAIIKAGIKRVVISNIDPNPKVNGNGVKILRENNIEVEVGILEREGEKLNEFYFHYIRTNKPFVILKFAQTLDGFIADENYKSKWISSEISLKFAHKLRSYVDAIAVGSNTVLKDNPYLTAREYYKPIQPIKVIFDSECKTLKYINELNIFKEGKVIIFSKIEKEIKMENVEIIKINNLEDALIELGKRKIISLLVEGGSKLLSSFLKENLFNKVYVVISPKILGKGISSFGDYLGSLENRLVLDKVLRLGEDILGVYYNKNFKNA
ncbi:MAG: bifunctional diaminohydroxyphosphoribosylaminopyrimidine deaminase/5-amino-6-(5-phosphoribosylamino)uracil reductase RibD [candidate division WOR-3 bacterium]|jgi:diaminohydroxyphosphoribosylaminopyrimidine deaminase/5-amino-6-(5-phosphoribosylamino)uracil reductase